MMLNPFARFDERFIAAFRNAKKRYLISQTFTRENNLFRNSGKHYLLLSHYDDPNLAKAHLKAVENDKFADTFDLENEKDRERVKSMVDINSDYVVYSILDLNPKATKIAFDKIFKYKIQKYIANNTNWRIGREQTYVPNLETTFGELFVVLKYSGQEIRVKLEELENL